MIVILSILVVVALALIAKIIEVEIKTRKEIKNLKL